MAFQRVNCFGSDTQMARSFTASRLPVATLDKLIEKLFGVVIPRNAKTWWLRL
jgi:hypothetical protein